MIKRFVTEKFMENLKNVYKMLNSILYEYEETNGFAFVDESKGDCRNYYDKRLQNIRKEVDCSFWYCKDARERLYGIIDDIMYIVGCCEIPGVPERWHKTNPNLDYYNGVYNVIDDDFDAFKKIRDGEMCFKFKFIPTLEDYIERKKYFEEKYKKYSDSNMEVNEDRICQDELVATLSVLFAMEFSEYAVENI
ncbi:MAG: hypothetical protein IJM94_04530 [Clostridia bacterium]|nr:hypothetical protein [Clostridia bacterium]